MADIVDKQNGFEFTFIDGGWIWKAIPIVKKVAAVKKEKPAYKISEAIEANYKKQFDKHLAMAMKDVSGYLNGN